MNRWSQLTLTRRDTQQDYDLVVVLTDGNPTYSTNREGSGSLTTFRELERAIFSANAIKAQDSRVITVGIGPGLSDHNLSAISGPAKHQPGAGINDIDYLTSSWEQLQTVLEDFAAGLSCEAAVTVNKVERDADGDDQGTGVGWQFSASKTGDGDLTSIASQTTGASGSVRFNIEFDHPEHEAQLAIAETQRAGWTLEEVTCSINGGQASPVVVTQGEFVLDGVGIGDRIECTAYNRELPSYVDLEVSVETTPSFERTYDWSVTKSVHDEQRQEVPAGVDATFTYDVVVTPSAPIDSNFLVTGTITVANPNDIDFTGVDVVHALPGVSCTADDGADLKVRANDRVELDYTCVLPSATATSSGTVTAAAEWDGDQFRGTSGVAQGSRTYDFAQASPAATNQLVEVHDTAVDLTEYADDLRTGNVVDARFGPATFTYDVTWPSVPGECATYENSATLTSTSITRQASSSTVQGTNTVTVEVCAGVDLTIDSTVTAEYERTYGWAIDKVGDTSEVDVDENGVATVDYTVEVAPAGYADSGWQVEGTITVTNPNEWLAITADVVDSVDILGGSECTVDGGDAVHIAAKQTVELDYACTFTSQPADTGTSTATVTWASAPTPMHSAVSTAEIATWDVTETNKTITVLDDKTDPADPTELGTVTWTDGAQQFTYSLTHDGVRAECIEHTNRAWIVETGQQDSWTVDVCWPVPGIDVVKTAWQGVSQLPVGAILPVGTEISWQYEVTNTGTAQLDDIEVADTYTNTDGASGEVSVTCPATSLAPGASMTCTGSGPVGTGVYGLAAP